MIFPLEIGGFFAEEEVVSPLDPGHSVLLSTVLSVSELDAIRAFRVLHRGEQRCVDGFVACSADFGGDLVIHGEASTADAS